MTCKFMATWNAVHKPDMGNWITVQPGLEDEEYFRIEKELRHNFIRNAKAAGYVFDETAAISKIKKDLKDDPLCQWVYIAVRCKADNRKHVAYRRRKVRETMRWTRRDTNRPGGRQRSYGTAARN